MTRTPWEYKARKPLKRGKGFKRATYRLGASKRATERPRGLRRKSRAPSAILKTDIQALLREIVIKRDRGCFIRSFRNCNGVPGRAVLQADHLITRGNAATYADSHLVVCVCRPCHLWKKYHKEEYDKIVKKLLPENRRILWEQMETQRYIPAHKVAYDWKLAKVALTQELKNLKAPMENFNNRSLPLLNPQQPPTRYSNQNLRSRKTLLSKVPHLPCKLNART